MMIRAWRCLKCGYMHISDFEGKLPARCPVCKSVRVKRMPLRPQKEGKYILSINEIYSFLNRIAGIKVLEQEKIRNNLRESGGVHILCLDKENGPLNKILTKNEAEKYLLLIKNQSFGLAIINRSIVAISKDSPIRPHVGINGSLLKELQEIFKKDH